MPPKADFLAGYSSTDKITKMHLSGGLSLAIYNLAVKLTRRR